MKEGSKASKQSNAHVRISDLCKSFDEKALFRHFELDINASGIYALVGESGKGKTTLLRIIAGLDTDYSGNVSVCGKISFCFQEHRLFPTLTASENLYEVVYQNANEYEKKRCADFLLSLGFSEKDLSLYPSELSGGMRQRVSFARAMLSDADILLFDEPTKELDLHHREKIRDLIKDAAKTKIVILVTHSSEDLGSLECNIIEI